MRPVDAERPTCWDGAMELQRGGPGTAAKLIMNDCDCCLAMPGDCCDCCLNGDGGGPNPLQRGVRPGVGAGPCGLAGKGLGLGVVPGLRLFKGLGRGLAVFGSLRLVSGVSQRFFALEECIGGAAINLLKVSRRPRPELPKPSFPELFGRGDGGRAFGDFGAGERPLVDDGRTLRFGGPLSFCNIARAESSRIAAC